MNGVMLKFHCKACAHQFRRKVRRVFIDIAALQRSVEKKAVSEPSPYIIPQPVVCPKCSAVNQYEIDVRDRVGLQAKVLVRALGGHPPDELVKPLTFTLYDGTVMHPVNAKAMYRQKLSTDPENITLRLRYANTLRTVGDYEEAEAEYRAVLERKPKQIEAWLNLAALQAVQGKKRAARESLQAMLKYAPQSGQPGWEDWASEARLFLDGKVPLQELTPDSLIVPIPTPKPATSRRQRTKSSHSRRKRRRK